MYLLQSLGWGQNDVLPSIHLGSSGKTLINEITKTQVGISIPGVVPVDVSVTRVDVDVASVGFVVLELYVIVELDVVSVVVVVSVVSVIVVESVNGVVFVVVPKVKVVELVVQILILINYLLRVGVVVVVESVIVDSVGDPEPPAHSAYSGKTQPLLFSLKSNPSEHSSTENIPLKHL
jgi:hypothetical protein